MADETCRASELALAHRSLRGLMDALRLSDSAATRQSFWRQFGCTPAEYRRGAMAALMA